jgi:hypothetical protein
VPLRIIQKRIGHASLDKHLAYYIEARQADLDVLGSYIPVSGQVLDKKNCFFGKI